VTGHGELSSPKSNKIKVGNEPSEAREHHERAERAEQMSEQTFLSAGERAW